MFLFQFCKTYIVKNVLCANNINKYQSEKTQQLMNSYLSHYGNDNQIKIQDQSFPKDLDLNSQLHAKETPPNDDQMKKIASIVTHLHEFYLQKSQHIEIYRDLSDDQQNMLIITDKNSHLHTALAGILAIQSCVKGIEKEEQFIVGNLVRIIHVVVGQFISFQDQINKIKSIASQKWLKFGDSLKYMLQQVSSLPAARARSSEILKHVANIGLGQISANYNENISEKVNLLTDLQRENDNLKFSLNQKESYIQVLQGKMDRKARSSKIQDKRTVHSIGIRFGTESQQNQAASNKDSIHPSEIELTRLKTELQDKNMIIKKMNEQFANEALKYSGILNQLEKQNKILKRYGDIDTCYLLEELEYEIELLKEEKRKDQNIIEEIHLKLEGFNMARNSRVNTARHYDNIGRSQRYYEQNYNIEPLPRFQYKNNHKYKKFASTTYNNANPHVSPSYNAGSPSYIPGTPSFNLGSPPYNNGLPSQHARVSRLRPQPELNFAYKKDIPSNNDYRSTSTYRNNMIQMIKNRLSEQKRKKTRQSRQSRQSRQRIDSMKDSQELREIRQVKSASNLNLYERVMRKW